MSVERKMKVAGMHCRSCEMLLRDVVLEISGVEEVTVDSRSGNVTVRGSSDAVFQAVRTAVEKEGYKVVQLER